MKNSATRCYVFDDTDCADDNFGFGLAAGDAFSLNETSKYYYNVAGLAVQTGCYLKFWTGNEIYFLNYIVFVKKFRILKIDLKVCHEFQAKTSLETNSS